MISNCCSRQVRMWRRMKKDDYWKLRRALVFRLSSTHTSTTSTGSSYDYYSVSGKSSLSTMAQTIEPMSTSASASTFPSSSGLEELMREKTTPLSLKAMYQYASRPEWRLANAQYLHRELPIRLAHRIMELQSLPFGLNQTSSIQSIIHVYNDYLLQIQQFEKPSSTTEEQQFTEFLMNLIMDRHSIPQSIYFGLSSLPLFDQPPQSLKLDESLEQLEFAINHFMMARVGLRFLTEHYVLSSPHPSVHQHLHHSYLRSSSKTSSSPTIGAISKSCDPLLEIHRVAKQVQQDCQMALGMAPPIQILDACNHHQPRHFTYVPHHLHYMMAELLINSCRAVVLRLLQPLLPIMIKVIIYRPYRSL